MKYNKGDKIVYFVRHAESVGNAQEIHQRPDFELSSKGIGQTEVLAERLLRVDFDIIISSSYMRTKQTAEIISKHKNVEILLADLFVEIRNPSEIIGKSIHAPDVVEIKNKIVANRKNPDWRHSDEETFSDVKTRARDALAFIQNRSEGHILVVTHRGFLRTLMACMLFGDNWTVKEQYTLFPFLYAANTGITECRYIQKELRWQLRTWNDQAHLG
jgi:broad specificity phosphatase PhoE